MKQYVNCPFCNAPAVALTVRNMELAFGSGQISPHVTCDGCGTSAPEYAWPVATEAECKACTCQPKGQIAVFVVTSEGMTPQGEE